MSTYQDTTPSEKKQILLRRRTPYPHVFAVLQHKINKEERLLLEWTLELEQISASLVIDRIVIQYQICRLRKSIKRDYEHLREITVS